MQKKLIMSYIFIMLAGALITVLLFFTTYQPHTDLSGTMLTIDQTRTRAFLVVLIITIIICLIFGWFLIMRNISNIRKLEYIRSHFVSNVTHELKTPLTSIKGFVDTLKGGAIHDEAVAERFLDIIEIEADRLYALITDTLELSEIETMSQDTRISDYMLKDIVDEVISIILPVAEKNNINLQIFISPSISIVRVNFDRLKQLLINILDNAIKYNNANGSVWLDCQLEGKTIIFTVRDNGIGIPEDQIPHLFERFYRVDKGRSRDNGGTGLGLSIVKHITQLYKGEIHLESRIDVGSTFTIRLPIAVA